MENLQRILFLILSTVIIVGVFTNFSTTEVDIKPDYKSARVLSKEEGFYIFEKTDLKPCLETEEVAEEEWCYVDDAAENKQEIVTEVKTE